MSAAFDQDSDKVVLSDGQTSCRDLGDRENVEAVLRSLRYKELDSFEAYLVAIFSTKYFCPQYFSQALTDVRQSLENSS
jgi:hypothetical protein